MDPDAVKVAHRNQAHERLSVGQVDHLGIVALHALKLRFKEVMGQVVILAKVSDHAVGSQGLQGNGLVLTHQGVIFGDDDVGLHIGQTAVDHPLGGEKLFHLPAALAVKVKYPHRGPAGEYVVDDLLGVALVEPVGEGGLVLVVEDHFDKALHYMRKLGHRDGKMVKFSGFYAGSPQTVHLLQHPGGML